MSECTHHFEHVKQTRPFAEREYMQCTKCGHQNPLGLFQHWDTERDGPAVKWSPRDNGGKLPAGLTTVTNRTGRPILISPFTVYRSLYPKTPRTRVYQTRHKYWRFACNKCPQGAESPDWKLIQKLATRHAHNHHGR